MFEPKSKNIIRCNVVILNCVSGFLPCVYKFETQIIIDPITRAHTHAVAVGKSLLHILIDHNKALRVKN